MNIKNDVHDFSELRISLKRDVDCELRQNKWPICKILGQELWNIYLIYLLNRVMRSNSWEKDHHKGFLEDLQRTSFRSIFIYGHICKGMMAISGEHIGYKSTYKGFECSSPLSEQNRRERILSVGRCWEEDCPGVRGFPVQSSLIRWGAIGREDAGEDWIAGEALDAGGELGRRRVALPGVFLPVFFLQSQGLRSSFHFAFSRYEARSSYWDSQPLFFDRLKAHCVYFLTMSVPMVRNSMWSTSSGVDSVRFVEQCLWKS